MEKEIIKIQVIGPCKSGKSAVALAIATMLCENGINVVLRDGEGVGDYVAVKSTYKQRLAAIAKQGAIRIDTVQANRKGAKKA